MINLDDRIISKFDAQEFYLLLCIAQFVNSTSGLAWPSAKTLLYKTGWSKNTLLAVRERLEAKKALKVDQRKRENGSFTSNAYRITIDGISTFKQFSQIEAGFEDDLGSSNFEPGVVQILNQGSSNFEPPELLSNITIKEKEQKAERKKRSVLPSDVEDKFAKIDGLKDKVGLSQYNLLNMIAADESYYANLKRLYADGKFDSLIDWLRYRKEVNKPYRIPAPIRLIVKDMLSNTKEDCAQGVKQAIKAQWAGLFIKPSGNYHNEKNFAQ